MSGRILLVDDSKPVVAAIRKDLEERGCEVDAAAPDDAEGLDPSCYSAALVRGTGNGAAVIAALRAKDALLPVVVLFLDRKEAAASPDAFSADGVLVGPLTASAVGTVCAFATKLRDLSERVQDLEGKLARRGAARGELEFLKTQLFLEVKRSKRYGYPLSIALVALDGWKESAPKLAARARTALLGELLGLVTGSLRDIDVAAPFAGERFIVVMPHTKAEGAVRVARRLCAKIRDRAAPPMLTASVGVAAHAGDGTVSFAALVKRAGEALSRALEQGGDRVEAADPVKKRDRISIG